MSWEYILLSTFRYKSAFSAIYRAKSAGKQPFRRHFHTFRAAWKAYLTSLTPPTTIPGPGTPPANSQCTMQFVSRPCGLLLSISEGGQRRQGHDLETPSLLLAIGEVIYDV